MTHADDVGVAGVVGVLADGVEFDETVVEKGFQ